MCAASGAVSLTGAGGRTRTDTRSEPHQILSLARLPIPPLRRVASPPRRPSGRPQRDTTTAAKYKSRLRGRRGPRAVLRCLCKALPAHGSRVSSPEPDVAPLPPPSAPQIHAQVARPAVLCPRICAGQALARCGPTASHAPPRAFISTPNRSDRVCSSISRTCVRGEAPGWSWRSP